MVCFFVCLFVCCCSGFFFYKKKIWSTWFLIYKDLIGRMNRFMESMVVGHNDASYLLLASDWDNVCLVCGGFWELVREFLDSVLYRNEVT